MSEENKTIRFEIVTPERIVFKKEILQATIPTELGEITILPNHIPLVSILIPGVIEIKQSDGNKNKIISVSNGFIEVLKNKIVILADTAERAEELDEQRIKEAQARAKELKKNNHPNNKINITEIDLQIKRELARERAIKKWRKIEHLK